MAKATCAICGEPMEYSQYKCQLISEIPLPKQTKPISTDGAIREGEPPHKAIGPTPSAEQMGLITMCALIGMVAGTLGMAIWSGIDYEKNSTDGIIPTESIMAFSGICCGAPIGLFAGIAVGGLLIAKKPFQPRNKSTQS